jgi:hypothetical protein
VSEPLDTEALRIDYSLPCAHDDHGIYRDFTAALDEVDRLRDERVTLLEHGEQRWDLYTKALRRARAAETKLAAVARVRDWMGENNDDAEYDLAIVALNNILEGGGRG